MKAKIGITTQYDNYLGTTKLTPFYAQAIERSGGVPYILPISRDLDVIKQMAEDYCVEDEEIQNKVALLGAITLYLDFINLFLYILRIFGKRK